MPSPKIIFQAFADIKPNLIVAVPLIIEKIIKKSVLPKLETPTMKLLLKVPIINDKIKATVREQMVQAFGGNFATVIVGGAAFNQEVEQFLCMIDFPYTVEMCIRDSFSPVIFSKPPTIIPLLLSPVILARPEKTIPRA